jgi:4-amino-4-deoxy-L-arabinose transferase-like glycosyltransferase
MKDNFLARKENIWFAIILFSVLMLLVANINGWQLEDDEGTSLYSIWRFAEGDMPYIDFSSTKAPLYLLIGKHAIQLVGNDLLLLRLFAAFGLAFALGVWAWIIKPVYGGLIAITFWCWTILTPEIYHLARLFRTDSLMLLFLFIALAALFAFASNNNRLNLIISGIFFGAALLSKVLAVMPLLGGSLWLVLFTWQRRGWRRGLGDLLTFSTSVMLIGGTGYIITESVAPGALAYVLGSPGDYDLSLYWRIIKGLVGWIFFLLYNPLLLFALAGLLLFARKELAKPEFQFWLAQVIGSLPFFLISGPPYSRYLAYVVPSLIMLLLTAGVTIREQFSQKHYKLPSIGLLLVIIIPLCMGIPSRHLLFNTEQDTQALTEWIMVNTEPDDVVVSDYAELNFHASRRSIPTQAVISNNWARTELITGELIKSQIEAEDAKLVLLHVPGGTVAPDHMFHMVDYDEFRAYLQQNLTLVMLFDRAGQKIEVYQRP